MFLWKRHVQKFLFEIWWLFCLWGSRPTPKSMICYWMQVIWNLSPQKNPHQVKNCDDSWKKECIKWTLITHLQKTFFTLSNIRCETKDCSGRILLFHPYHSKQNASLLDIKAHGNSHWFKFTECYKNRRMMHALTPWISCKLNCQDFREE